MHERVVGADMYLGFHFIIFENTNPDDGTMVWNGRYISVDELLDILTFAGEDIHYQTDPRIFRCKSLKQVGKLGRGGYD